MTHSHNTQQYLQHPYPDIVNILYTVEVQWTLDDHEIDFVFVLRYISIFHPGLTSFYHISKTYGPICRYMVQ